MSPIFDLKFKIDVDKTIAALDKIAEAVKLATPEALDAAADQTVSDMKRLLYRTDHPRNTHTPSAPGQPPSRVSGSLAASVRKGPVTRLGDTWTCEIGPHIIYGRIQELGGNSGRHDRTHLPPRPYMHPAIEELLAVGFYTDVFYYHWNNALAAGVI